MTRLFVSYSRTDKSRVKRLIPLLSNLYGASNVWWDENFYGGQVWWEEILKQIADCEMFIFLVSPRSLGSPYCLAELEEARRLHKKIIPVKFTSGTQVPEALARLQYVELVGPINRKTIEPLHRAIIHHSQQPISNAKPITNNPVSLPLVPVKEPRNYLAEFGSQILIGLLVTVVGGIVLAWIIQATSSPTSPAPTALPTATVTPTDAPTPTPSNTPQPTNTVDLVELVAGETATSRAATIASERSVNNTLTATFFFLTATRQAADAVDTRAAQLLSTLETWTPTPTFTATATITPTSDANLQSRRAEYNAARSDNSAYLSSIIRLVFIGALYFIFISILILNISSLFNSYNRSTRYSPLTLVGISIVCVVLLIYFYPTFSLDWCIGFYSGLLGSACPP